MAVAIQPAMPHHSVSPVQIATARPQPPKRRMSGKEILPQSLKAASFPGVTTARARRERPCDACRRRKSRCVIHEGAVLCVLCEFHKQDCTFVQDPQPRKRKVAGDAEKKDCTPKKRSVDPACTSPPKPVLQRAPTRPSVSPAQGPQAQIENHVLGETLGLQRSKHSRYIGLTSSFDPVLVGLSHFNSRGESNLNVGTLRRVNEHETFIMISDDHTNTTEHGSDSEAIDEINRIVAPHGAALVDIYFRIVHPSFPIIQKHIFLERFRTSGHNVSPPLIAGMYILALNWWSHDSELAQHPRPDISALDAIASETLAAAMLRPKLSTVQAGLLLLQRPEADSWSLTTQLVAIGQELGLHLDSSAWSIPLWERGLRKRIAWALYMQDKWSSLIHGRPSHIFGANWAVKDMSQDDITEEALVNANYAAETDEEKAESEKGQIIFSQMISLTGIMSEIMDTFYTQIAIQDFAAAGKNSTKLILERAKPVQIKLKEWFSKLPASVRMDNVVPNQLSSTGFLHLAYFATEITLHRRIVQSLNNPLNSSTTPSSTTHSSPPDPYLLYICRSAAKTRLISAMDFVNRLRPEHLRAFWYFPSKTNFTLIGTFGGLLWATAPAKEEAEFYRLRLREYRWTLTVSAERAGFLRFAVEMLDTSRDMLKNLAEKPSLADTKVSRIGVPDSSITNHRASSKPSYQPQRGPQQNYNGAKSNEFSNIGSSSAYGKMDQDPGEPMDMEMDEVQSNMRGGNNIGPSSLSRVTSTSAFSGFSNETELFENGQRSPGTPPSSVG
ncbi:nitrogen regulatory protein OTam [Venturia nashicola]|uniref:Nitrogen regulatory protein OTam n=1 Tax=Venturia nashicola TaxID=86259 RepID=A0A4Z1P8B6_9PEZI|nr:nitrogen regulatory protein OTam [Venturia nashicola]TLD26231.1 nitrogen regulatory protein OTam [Venturia nashicola]